MNADDSTRTIGRFRNGWRGGLLPGALLAMSAGWALDSTAAEPVVHSTGHILRHPVYDFAQPAWPRRVTRPAWHVRTNRYVVTCTSGPEHAHLVAREIDEAWGRIADLSDHWTSAHRKPGFAAGTLGVLVDDQPVRHHRAPAPVLSVQGDMTQIYIGTSGGAPTLSQQLPRLRQATVRAFLHAGQFDWKLPEWVCHGLAVYVASNDVATPVGTPAESIPLPNAIVATAKLSQQINRGQRAESVDRDLCGQWVRYLIEGDNARHSPAFFAAMQETIGQAERQRRRRGGLERSWRWRGEGNFVSPQPSALDNLMVRVRQKGSVDDGLKDREVDQPLLNTKKVGGR